MTRMAVVVALALMCFANVCMAQSNGETQRRVAEIERKLSEQERTLADLKEEGGIAVVCLFLFGLVLSMWAMNRQRSGCAWFILGFIPMVNIIAGLVALSAECERRKSSAPQE